MGSDSEDEKRQTLRNKRKAHQNDSEEEQEEDVKIISSTFKDVQITPTPKEPTLNLEQEITPDENNEKIEINQKNISDEKKSRFNRIENEDERSYFSQTQTKKSFGRENEEPRTQMREDQEPVQRNMEKEIIENENSFFSKKNRSNDLTSNSRKYVGMDQREGSPRVDQTNNNSGSRLGETQFVQQSGFGNKNKIDYNKEREEARGPSSNYENNQDYQKQGFGQRRPFGQRNNDFNGRNDNNNDWVRIKNNYPANRFGGERKFYNGSNVRPKRDGSNDSGGRGNFNNRGDNFRGGRGRGNFYDRGQNNQNNDGSNRYYNNNYGNPNHNRNNNSYNNQYRENEFVFQNKELFESIRKNFKFLDDYKIEEVLKIALLSPGITVFELLNEFSRENMIQMHKNSKNLREFTSRVSIFEIYERDLEPCHQYMMKSYKTMMKTEERLSSQMEDYADGLERRRAVLRNIDGFYNYIPILCENHPPSKSIVDTTDVEKCVFAHSDNEIMYHPLIYLTTFCLNSKDCKSICHNSHGLNKGQGFRRIYDFKRKEMIDLSLTLQNCELLKKNIRSYDSLLEIPTEFSLDTYKTVECKLKSMCNKDTHLCYSYHDIQERRRHPRLYKLLNEICNYAQPSSNSPFFPEHCPLKDNCEKMHSRYELLYHQENFRKLKTCQRPKKQGRCMYFLTCYGVHTEDNISESNQSDILKNYIHVEEYSKLKNELNELKSQNSNFQCHHCKKVPSSAKYVMNKCKHILCEICAKKMLNEIEKKCLVCGVLVEKNSAVRVFFKD